MSTPVTEQLRELCDDAARNLSGPATRTAVEAVGHKLGEPLQVTVAGGVSSGKSTVVNALLGQRIAAVDAGECTRVVTRFRYSHHERAEVDLTDGTTRTVALERGSLPAHLGVPLDQVRQVVVHLSNAGLRQLAIVDTPGLDTVTRANEDSTVSFLGVGAVDGRSDATGDPDRGTRDTAACIGSADALVFLMPHLRQADADVLSAFRRLYDGTGLSAFNAVAVLSKVDQLSPTGDPMETAAPIVARMTTATRGVVSDVLPIIGLLAETATTARLTEDDARALSVLAAFGDDLDREDLLLSPDAFLTLDGPDVAVDRRRRILEMCGMHGIQIALETLDRGARGAAPILRAFEERSGFAPLERLVLERFGRQAHLIKANNALCDLRRLSYQRADDPDDAATLRSLRSPLDRLALDPTLHHLRVVQVLHDHANGEFTVPEALLVDLERLATSSDPAERVGVTSSTDVADAALAGAARWGRFANDPRRRPMDVRRARAVKEAYELLWATHAPKEATA